MTRDEIVDVVVEALARAVAADLLRRPPDESDDEQPEPDEHAEAA